MSIYFGHLKILLLLLQTIVWVQGKNSYEDPKTIEMKSRNDLQGLEHKSVHDVNSYPFSLLRNIDEPIESTDIAFFWHIPKSAGSGLKHMMGACMAKIAACNDAALFCGDPLQEKRLELCSTGFGTFVNVETGHAAGIKKAKSLGFASSGLADVVISNYFFFASDLFNPSHKGRAFALFRHPVDRIVSTFYYLGKATWEPNYNPEYASMTILEYAQRSLSPTNWVTRSMLGALDNVNVIITEDDMNMLKEVLRRKVLILLSDEFLPSFNRLISYLGWEQFNPDVRNCVMEDINKRTNSNEYTALEKGSEAWSLIANRNMYDIQLYEYAKELYEEQKGLVRSSEVISLNS